MAALLRPCIEDLRLRVTDLRPPVGWDAAETVVGDITDRAFATEVLDGTEAVVHLAANPSPAATWDELRGPNADGLVGLLEAARDLDVRRVVLASSVHTMLGYVLLGEEFVEADRPAAPCCAYGASKVFAEAVGHVIASTSRTSVVCLRLGACFPTPPTRTELPSWLGPADLQQLVRAALDADVRYGRYFGISANTPPVFDLSNVRRELGYGPVLDSAAYAADVRKGDGTFGHTPSPNPSPRPSQ